MKKFLITTLGCRTNQYESQLFSDQLRKKGYVSADDSDVDLCIVNTCKVTDQAEASSRRQIHLLARKYPHSRLVVTGCLASSLKEDLLAIDPRIEVLPNKSKMELFSFLFPGENSVQGIERFDGHTRAFIKVQDGCNAYCSYCIIPSTRGRSHSRSTMEIVQEVQTLIANGYREIVLTGVNLGDYEAGDVSLADLVRQIDSLDGLSRLRLSSIDPTHVTDSLVEVLLNGRCTCPNLHLVLQSGSNAVLKRMNRKYTRELYLQTVERLVRVNPDFTFTTDAIVGFPGENDADFRDTLDVVRQVQFAKVHVFPYSVRSGTRAALFPDHLPPDTIRQRRDELLETAQDAAFALRQSFLHRTMEVLLERGSSDALSGHTANFLAVDLPDCHHSPNELASVKLYENHLLGFLGRVE